MMQFLGRLEGEASLTRSGEHVARAHYELDGFLGRNGQITGSGELQLKPEILRELFGLPTLGLVTDDGHHLTIQFTDKKLAADSDIAHIILTGTLPGRKEWRH